MTDLYQNLINGKWIDSGSGETFANINPADRDDIVGNFQDSTVADIEAAVAAAQQARSGWRALGAPRRGEILARAARLIERDLEKIAAGLTREEGKTLPEARGETARAVQIFDYFAGEGRRLSGETTPSEFGRTLLYTVREPLGVVGLITPWNFPVAIPAWKLAPALVSGNTVVLKPASGAPLTALNIVRALEEAGLPAGVLNFVTGSGSVAGVGLVASGAVAGVSFTGSDTVGCGIYALVTGRGGKAQCEMGGKNPLIVLADADIDKAVELAINGAMWSTGQKCTATSRAIVHQSVVEEFTEKLLAGVADIRVGNGAEPETQVGPSIDETQLQTVLRYIDIGKEEGARLLAGGERLTDPPLDRGFFVAPTVFGDVTPQMRIAQEEIFGPVLAVIAVADFEEAMQVANSVRFGLSASICTRDLTRAMEFIDRIEAGLVHVNSPTVGAEVQVPFGGMKDSSTGTREQGRVAIDFYTEIKTVYLEY
ncbi:MAG: aldehyde dehydrogenase family protein [Actinomycetota bacterium]|nr:aldehyde dehydrogenase family protein [Actinomycetota bacterium]MDA8167550.1 aldehyde dehydrogenase family protein [Actinomycetota bacterium]